jgi:hypothetical protein
VAVLSTQLWYQSFFRSPLRAEPLPLGDADVLLGDAATGALSTSFAVAS